MPNDSLDGIYDKVLKAAFKKWMIKEQDEKHFDLVWQGYKTRGSKEEKVCLDLDDDEAFGQPMQQYNEDINKGRLYPALIVTLETKDEYK